MNVRSGRNMKKNISQLKQCGMCQINIEPGLTSRDLLGTILRPRVLLEVIGFVNVENLDKMKVILYPDNARFTGTCH